jgi:uncharacterized membrane protein required for colicin V production
MILDKLPINWFDFLLVFVLLAGVLRGRKNGMSEELMPLLQWLAIVCVGAYFYETIGQPVADATVLSSLFSYVATYLGVAVLIKVCVSLLKRLSKGKLVGSDLFGKGEYYLGMVGGMVRFGCVLIAALALLNARYFSPEEIKATKAYREEVYGKDYFPGLIAAQQAVFEQSLTGPWIKANLGFLLIKPTAPEKKQLKRPELNLP